MTCVTKQQEHTIKWTHRCCREFPCDVVYAGNIRRAGESASCMVLYKASLLKRVPVWRSLRREYTPHWEFVYDAVYAALRVPVWRSLRKQYTPHWEFPYDVVYVSNIRRTESSCMTQFTQEIYWHRTGRSASCMVLDKALLFQRVPVWRSLRREYTLHWWICVMHGSW